MKDIFVRTKEIALFTISNNATVRQTAKVFGLSKSTVHYDLTQRLPAIDWALFLEVREILDKNEQEKSMRGGLATKDKYLKQKRICLNKKNVCKNANWFFRNIKILLKLLTIIIFVNKIIFETKYH